MLVLLGKKYYNFYNHCNIITINLLIQLFLCIKLSFKTKLKRNNWFRFSVLNTIEMLIKMSISKTKVLEFNVNHVLNQYFGYTHFKEYY